MKKQIQFELLIMKIIKSDSISHSSCSLSVPSDAYNSTQWIFYVFNRDTVNCSASLGNLEALNVVSIQVANECLNKHKCTGVFCNP